MITRFITDVQLKFNPFSKKAKASRIFLSFFGPNARQNVKIETKVLPRASKDRSSIYVKFKDGKELKLDPEEIGIKGIIEEVDRKSRMLGRQDQLAGN